MLVTSRIAKLSFNHSTLTPASLLSRSLTIHCIGKTHHLHGKLITFVENLSVMHAEVNECLESKDVCDRNAVCIDTLQSYECRCKAGYYQGIGKECIKGE